MPMKNTLRAKLVAGATVLGLGMSLAFTGTAFAANVFTWDSDTTVTLGSNDYTIIANSQADAFAIGASTITVTVAAGDVFVLRSSSRFPLSNDEGVTIFCGPSYSELEINGNTEADEVVITPATGTTCSGSGSGGGGGGSTPAPTPTPTPETPSPSAAVHPSGTLVISNGTVYLIQNGMRVGFRNAAEYMSHGYNFNQVVQASSGDLALPLSSSVVKALEGTLVLDSSDGVTVYMIGSNGTKRGFASSAVFTELGYNFANIPSINLSDYPAGDPVNSSMLAHPDGALVLSGGTVWWIRGSQRLGFESEAVFNTYGFSWSKIVTANSADLALTEGSLVKFRDGTLVYDGGNYYLISGGTKRMFSSSSDMSARGYMASNAINASLANYASGGTVQ